MRTTKKFVAIELHPAIYVSFVAINLCLVFVYREMTTPSHVVESTEPPFASSRLDDHHGLRPSVDVPVLNRVDATALDGSVADDLAVEHVAVKKDTNVAKSTASPEEVAAPAVVASVAALKSSGAAIAATPEKAAKPKKKKSHYNGLVPPPPPGVMVVPPPPDAPSLFIGGSAGKVGFLVPPPPPMVFSDNSFSDFSGSGDPYMSTGGRSFRKTNAAHRTHGDFRNNDRAKTVTRGSYKQVIVSR